MTWNELPVVDQEEILKEFELKSAEAVLAGAQARVNGLRDKSEAAMRAAVRHSARANAYLAVVSALQSARGLR